MIRKLEEGLLDSARQLQETKAAYHKFVVDSQGPVLALEEASLAAKMKEEEIRVLQEQVKVSSTRCDDAKAELALAREQLWSSRSTETRDSSRISQLEQALDRERVARDAGERSVRSLEVELAAAAKYKVQVQELEAASTRSSELSRGHLDAKAHALHRAESLEAALVTRTCRNLTQNCHNLTRNCNPRYQSCHNFTQNCHNLTPNCNPRLYRPVVWPSCNQPLSRMIMTSPR